MRALLRGERVGSVGVVLGLFALLCLLASSLGLTLEYRAQIQDFKKTVYERCLQRAAYDESNHASVVADVELYQQILSLQDRVPEQTDPRRQALTREYRDAIVQAKTRKEKAAAQGVIGSCAIYK
jgi:hypothetical protein